MKLKPYPEYKESGLVFVDSLPAAWKTVLLKRVARIRYGLGQPPKESSTGLPMIRATNISKGNITHEGLVFVDPTEIPEKKDAFLKEGEIIVVRSGAYTADSARVTRLYAGSIVGYDMVVTPISIDSRFLQWCLLSPYVLRDQLTPSSMRAAQPHLNAEELGSTELLLPPPKEQTQIARFLDWKTAQIDRFIRAKRRLIALLKEQKQALINQAVTGAIDVRTGKPYPEYKDSGVPWLGKVPAHWEVAALRLKYEQCLGKMLDSKRITGAAPVRYLRNTDVQWDRINTRDLPVMDIAPEEYERYTVIAGDLLVCEGGEVGRAAIWQGEITPCGFQKALHRLRPRPGTPQEPRFLLYALRIASGRQAFSDGHVSTIAHLTGEKLRAFRFAFPPLAEQTAIVEFLDEQTATIDRAADAARREIGLIQEYRTRLIADVVTGKLDVRGVAVPEMGSIEERKAQLAANGQPDLEALVEPAA